MNEAHPTYNRFHGGLFFGLIGVTVIMMLLWNAAQFVYNQSCSLKTASDTGPCWDYFMYRWQTLIAAVLAILTAFLGAAFVYHQTNNASRLEEEKRQARKLAARAVLPLVLSSLSHYALECMELLRKPYDLILRTPGDARDQLSLDDLPELPHDGIAVIRDFIESAKQTEANVFAELLSKLQIQHSNLRQAKREFETGQAPANIEGVIEDYVYHAGFIYARAADLFRYARFESEVEPFVEDMKKLHNALFIARFLDADYQKLHARASAKYSKKQSPSDIDVRIATTS